MQYSEIVCMAIALTIMHVKVNSYIFETTLCILLDIFLELCVTVCDTEI